MAAIQEIYNEIKKQQNNYLKCDNICIFKTLLLLLLLSNLFVVFNSTNHRSHHHLLLNQTIKLRLNADALFISCSC